MARSASSITFWPRIRYIWRAMRSMGIGELVLSFVMFRPSVEGGHSFCQAADSRCQASKTAKLHFFPAQESAGASHRAEAPHSPYEPVAAWDPVIREGNERPIPV